MNEHYYNQKPSAEHDEKFIKNLFFGKEFIFKTDAGVFSKGKVDFGSALLIKTFSHKNNAKVLDLGCGYGPIGIVVASKLVKGEVLLADINERAVGLAKFNINNNDNLINDNTAISVLQSSGFEEIKDKDFDYIILNPPIRAGKSVIFNMYEEASNHLKENGELWIVIQKKQGAFSTIRKLNTIYSIVEEVEREKGYHIIKSIKNN